MLAVDLDAIGDTRPLWRAWLESARTVLERRPRSPPCRPRRCGRGARPGGCGNWRTLLERFSEDRAPAFLRRDAATSAALRALAAEGATLGVFTDAPEALAQVALAQLGAARRVSAVETGAGALERLLDRLGPDAVVVRTRDDLLARP